MTLQSDESTAEVEPICVGDLPEDLTACAGAPQNLGAVELDETRKATLTVPLEVATGGYRVLVDGDRLPGLDGILNERNQVLRVPEAVIAESGETVVTVEALRSREHPIAVWQFLLSDPAAPPDWSLHRRP